MPSSLCSSYGAIRKVRMVLDNKTKKPRGYAFIEFERERDTRNAYKQASHRIASHDIGCEVLSCGD